MHLPTPLFFHKLAVVAEKPGPQAFQQCRRCADRSRVRVVNSAVQGVVAGAVHGKEQAADHDLLHGHLVFGK